MNKFESKFFKLLEKDLEEAIPPEAMTAEGDEEALVNSLEDPNTASEFKTDPNLPGFKEKYEQRMKDWVLKINEFIDWLNSPDGDSLNKQLITLDKPNTPFEGIASEAKKITSVAEDLAKLSQTINGVLLRSSKVERDISRSQQGY